MPSSQGLSKVHSEADFSTKQEGNASCTAEGTTAAYSSRTPATVTAGKCTSQADSRTFVIHAIPAVDPLVGELFVCPQTLEAVCLNRMLGLPLTLTWERLPSPCQPSDAEAPDKLLWWPLASKGTLLPAAVDPATGRLLSGGTLMEALRKACTQQEVPGAVSEHTANTSGLHNAMGSQKIDASYVRDHTLSHQPLYIGTYEAEYSEKVNRATQLATTEIVQQAVQAALRFYLWKDESTFTGFTKPMFQKSLGMAYGTYYCWSMRRGIRGASTWSSSPRVSPGDLARPFPKAIGPGAAHEEPTMEELLILDGLSRGLRVVEQLLYGRPFLGGSQGNTVDATVFAHLAILFSIPLPDRRELQDVLSNRLALFEYCRRVQARYNIWPAGPSLLFGVSSRSNMITGLPMRVHSWRQWHGTSPHGGYEGQQDAGSARDMCRILWWLGSAVFCAALLVVAGKTPLRIGASNRRTPSSGSPDLLTDDEDGVIEADAT